MRNYELNSACWELLKSGDEMFFSVRRALFSDEITPQIFKVAAEEVLVEAGIKGLDLSLKASVM